MIQRGSSLHCPPVTFQPARDPCSCLLHSSATLYYCFTFQLLFCYAIGNLVLLTMVITVKPNISVFCCFSYTSSMEKTVLMKDYILLFFVIFSYALLLSMPPKFFLLSLYPCHGFTALVCRLSVLPCPVTC